MLEATVKRRKSNGVPILSRDEMNQMGENLVKIFSPEILTNPAPFDIDAFLEQEMNLCLDFACLSHTGFLLGLCAFNDMLHSVWNPDKHEAEWLEVKAGTVLIDKSLLRKGQEKRLRFTLGHEVAGHAYLHGPYFCQCKNQMSFLDELPCPVYPCKNVGSYFSSSRRTDRDWMEWQADCMAAAVLMPLTPCKILLEQARKDFGLDRSFIQNEFFNEYFTQLISDTFDVSKRAAEIRAKELNNNNQSFFG